MSAFPGLGLVANTAGPSVLLESPLVVLVGGALCKWLNGRWRRNHPESPPANSTVFFVVLAVSVVLSVLGAALSEEIRTRWTPGAGFIALAPGWWLVSMITWRIAAGGRSPQSALSAATVASVVLMGWPLIVPLSEDFIGGLGVLYVFPLLASPVVGLVMLICLAVMVWLTRKGRTAPST
ncbi:MAG: hypothetical protein ACE366_07365 [Bradymonadia bacterium]